MMTPGEIDAAALLMLRVVVSGPTAWEDIAVPEMTGEQARGFVKMAELDPDVRSVLNMSWLEAQRTAIERYIGRAFHELELWAVESGRVDLLVTNRELLEQALRRG